MSYFHLVGTTDGLVRSRHFDDFDDAHADAKKTYETGQHMDIRGDVIPQLPSETIDKVEAEGNTYQKGLFWLGSNRYGAVFSTGRSEE